MPIRIPNLIANDLLMLFDYYQGPVRRWHDIMHPFTMLRAAREHDLVLTEVQIWAVLYHDAIYDPASFDNEERSAELARRHLDRLFTAEDLDLLTTVILDTKRHKPSGPESAPVIDLDLMVIGDTRERYADHAVQIWREYRTIAPPDVYRTHRIAFFKDQLLQRDPFFYTDAFKPWTERAIANVEWELDRLERGVWPPPSDTDE